MTRQVPSGRFDGDAVIVTGSTRGIGEAIAKRFAREGASVVVSGRTAAAGEATVAAVHEAGGEATFVETDMRDPDAIAALVEATADEYGGVDVLVNNAAVQTETGADDATMDDWNFVLETDLRGYWLAAKHAHERMDEGAIVNVSSNHAFLTMPGIFPYNAVKAGIDGMTRAMALDFGPRVRVNTINPGWVGVERTLEDIEAVGPDYLEHLESIHPLGQIGDPEDVAGVATFLASDDAAFVTGASLLVDGGRTAVMQDDALPDYRARRAGAPGYQDG